MVNCAVVLGGGGARGPYQIGAWQALRELGVNYSIVTGTSVGAINGAYMIQGDFDLARQTWESLTVSDVIANPPDPSEGRIQFLAFMRQMVERGGMDAGPLEDILRRTLDEQKIRASSIEYGVVTAQLPLFKPVQLLKSDIPEGALLDYVLASAAWFPFFQKRTIDGIDYIDGAYADNLPAELAVKCGATEIVAIDLKGTGIIHTFRGDIPVIHIRSHWNLGGMMEFDTDKAKRSIRLGYLDGLKAFRKLEGSAYTFHPGETRKNAVALRDAIGRLSTRTGVGLFNDYLRIPRIQDMLRYQGKNERFLHRPASKCTPGRAITTAAEIAGELLQIPPDKTYTLLQFNRLLLEQVQLLRFPRDKNEANSLFHPPNPDSIPAKRPRLVLRMLYDMLWDGYCKGEISSACRRLAAISPVEFVAANYLVALELNYRNPAGRAKGE